MIFMIKTLIKSKTTTARKRRTINFLNQQQKEIAEKYQI